VDIVTVPSGLLSLRWRCSATWGRRPCPGNGFIAAFVSGLFFATASGSGRTRVRLQFTEATSLLASYVVWLAFGAAMVGPALSRSSLGSFVVAVGALTLARAVPVALTMVGTAGERRPSLSWAG